MELHALHDRTSRLLLFIESEPFDLLPQPCQADLEEQFSHMVSYEEVLSRRISWACGNFHD